MNNKDFNLEDLECIRLLAGKELKFLQARREQYEQDDKMPFLKKEKKLEQVNSDLSQVALLEAKAMHQQAEITIKVLGDEES